LNELKIDSINYAGWVDQANAKKKDEESRLNAETESKKKADGQALIKAEAEAKQKAEAKQGGEHYASIHATQENVSHSDGKIWDNFEQGFD
jgi:membrane protein involved in colicin uptake